MRRLIVLLFCLSLVGTIQAQEGIKLSIGQYRILDDSDSYDFTPVSIKYSTQQYQARLTLPYINGYQGESGLGNISIKLSYLTQWKKTFIDLNYRQKLATADDKLTVPVRDSGMSIELARYVAGGIGFVELGHTWGRKAQSNQAERNDRFYYALGGVYPVSPSVSLGLILDHKSTALGQLDRSVSLISQYKLTKKNRLGISIAKGLTTASPSWLIGGMWSHKF